MDKAAIIERLERACSVREYCKSDILRRITQLKGDDNVDGHEIISHLCSARFIDEKRYASAFARDRSALRGWGVRKIRHALAAKGLSEEDITCGLEQIDAARASQRMEGVLMSRLRSLEAAGGDIFPKLCRFGMGRGYTYRHIKEFYDNNRTD